MIDSSDNFIVVTGANGRLGRGIVERLLERVPASRVGVSVRDAAAAEALTARGVRVRAGDYDDPGSLASAFAGAAQVLIVSVDALGEVAVGRHRRAIEAARAAGARRVLYTSHQHCEAGSPFAAAPDHAATEASLAGAPYTSLRNGFYASTTLHLLGQAAETGRLVAPEDGPVSWTVVADLAEAAAIVLADEGRFDGPTPPLTAGEALDLEAVTAIASEVLGREIERVVVSDRAYVTGLVEHGVPGEQAELFLGLFEAARAGAFDVVDPCLGQLLGRPPVALRDFLAGALGR
jgi:NAD(P)H dehydrogenase (quinone)